jgi:iron complex transport system substrate-binding protein
MRVVSLVPAATELVCALGRAAALVGVSHECDFPPEVCTLPKVTRPRFEATGTSRTIDEQVRRALARGEPLYEVLPDMLRALLPDVVLVQDQCQVCALPASEVEEARAALRLQFEVVKLHAHDLEGIWSDFARVADALGCGAEGRQFVENCQGELEAVRKRTARARYRPAVLCLEWLDPPMVAGNWMPELVDIAGGRSLLAEPGNSSRPCDWETILAAAPEVLILMPCGFPIERTLAELDALRAAPVWSRLPAVRNGRTYVTDGNAYFNRPGPRIVDSARILAGLLQPGLCAHWLPDGSWQRVAE